MNRTMDNKQQETNMGEIMWSLSAQGMVAYCIGCVSVGLVAAAADLLPTLNTRKPVIARLLRKHMGGV